MMLMQSLFGKHSISRIAGGTAWVVILGVLMSAAFASPKPSAPGGMAAVEALRVTEEGARTVVTIVGNATPTFTVFKLERPSRVVIDVANAELGKSIETESLGSTWSLTGLQATQIRDEAAAIARIVLTLRRAAEYDVKAQGKNI